MELKIEYLPIGELTPYEKNARKHADDDVDAIAASIWRFGFDDPIGVWGERNVIVEGHGRLLAAQKLGMETVPVIRLDHLTDEERRAYALAHNRTAELSRWDMAAAAEEIAAVAIDMSEFGFAAADAHEFFLTDDHGGTEREEGNDEYNEFLAKYEPKKTTDDCYTPPEIYDVICGWVEKEYGVRREMFVRPFYPGGDYRGQQYRPGEIVVDNPPFSILSEIVRFYRESGVPFFLFAPALTAFSTEATAEGVTVICAGGQIRYENGAVVFTSFITSLGDTSIVARTAPTLSDVVRKATDALAAEGRKEVPKYEFPDAVVTAALMQKWSRYGVEFAVKRTDAKFIRTLDAMDAVDKGIFGGGLLLSERAAAERAAAERAAAERWELSDREREIMKSLGGGDEA